MIAAAAVPARLGPREDSPCPAPPPEKLPPREPVVPAKLRASMPFKTAQRTL